MKFKLISDFVPSGSQPQAIEALSDGIRQNMNFQTLLGVTGSGKTFTMANVINQVQMPTLVIAHNKTLASQLYNEFSAFFPQNRVEYFVSFYDYYQPESYIPQKDQYIEKDSQINQKIEQMRISATASLSSRLDVIIVASVSCIYNIGNPEFYRDQGIDFSIGQKILRSDLTRHLINIQYERNDLEISPGKFRLRGNTIDIVPGYYDNIIRIEIFGDTIDRITDINRISGEKIANLKHYYLFPARHFVIPQSNKLKATKHIRQELEDHLKTLDLIKAHRLKQRTFYDIEMIEETGFCKGIENYSRFFDHRKPGEKPFNLMDYFLDKFLIIIDESHQTLPQLRAMYRGDLSRKRNLVDYGFRLPSAYDNRPLKFEEIEGYLKSNPVVFVSATPSEYEKEKSSRIVEQIIRPTGLLDPEVSVLPSHNQIPDLINKIRQTIKLDNRILVTTLTKKSAEELTDYLAAADIQTRYLHSDIDTIERSEIIRELRLGKFDVLVGINLLREGLDIPEVGFIGILDADKEGFLRDERSLIQIIGRAARNLNSRVVLYADRITKSITAALRETNRRRNLQSEYNKKHGIIPERIIKPVKAREVEIRDIKHIPKGNIPNLIIEIETDMKKAAKNLDFEKAIFLRDKIRGLKEKLK
jgi:excinuclease ABC subunit B